MGKLQSQARSSQQESLRVKLPRAALGGCTREGSEVEVPKF